MATDGFENFKMGFIAGADLSAGQYKIVQVTSDNVVKFATAALAAGVAGVLQDKPAAAGRACKVVILGKTKAYLGATLTIGQKVYAAASGWCGKVTSGYAPIGIVSKTASSGYVGEVLLTGMGNTAANSFVAGAI